VIKNKCKEFLYDSPNDVIEKEEDQALDLAFLDTIVSKLGTCFYTPEEIIIKQGEESDCMYYITQGDCTVNFLDEKRVEQVAVKLLIEG